VRSLTFVIENQEFITFELVKSKRRRTEEILRSSRERPGFMNNIVGDISLYVEWILRKSMNFFVF